MDKYREVVLQWCEVAGEYDKLDVLKAMEIERLDRIAKALEGIEMYLDTLVKYREESH